VHVGKHIFDHVIGPSGCLRSKTRLLVTTKFSILPQVDQIVYISRGQVREVGSFDQMINTGGPFSEYVAEYFIDRQLQEGEGLTDDELEFMAQVEPQIKTVIERVEMSRSSSIYLRTVTPTRQQSTSRMTTATNSKSFYRSDLVQAIFPSEGRLVQEEEMGEGAVKRSNQLSYYRTIGFWVCGSILLALMLSNVFQ